MKGHPWPDPSRRRARSPPCPSPPPLLTASPAPAATAGAAALPTGFATVVNAASGRCLDARAAATANGTVVQQYACNGSTAQQWTFTDAGDGYVRIANRNDTGRVADVADVSTADNAPVHLWSYGGGANQQWLPVDDGGGAFHFVNRHSGKCLDDPGASLADSVQFVQYTCNGSAAQRFQVVPVTPSASNPDLGPNVVVFDPSMSSSAIQSKLDTIFEQQGDQPVRPPAPRRPVQARRLRRETSTSASTPRCSASA